MLMISTVTIVLVVVALSFLIKQSIGRDRDKLQDWSHIATISAGLAATISFAWAASTFYEGARLQRELTALNLYREHLEMSVTHPGLASPDSSISPAMRVEQYEWYVGHALLSFETIFDADARDEEWQATAEEFILRHRSYIASDRFVCEQYTREVRDLVNRTLDSDRCDL